MLSFIIRMRLLSLAIIAQSCVLLAGERVKVKIIDRRDSEQSYSYTTPAHVQSTSNTDTNCALYPNSANCNSTTTTQGTVVPSRHISYSVSGATFSLQLSDGKIVVVNCASKYKLRGDYINRRSCRTPIVDEIEVEFSKDSAKLFWPVSLDGKKTDSETYKIIRILNNNQ